MIVEDTQSPELIGIPADASASCGEIPAPPAIGSDITATDNCDVNVNITFNEVQSQGNCAESYILTRTWTARDNCCLLYTSPSPRDATLSRMPSSA